VLTDVQWARDLFEGLFRQPVETAKQFLTDAKFIDRLMKLPGSQPVSLMISLCWYGGGVAYNVEKEKGKQEYLYSAFYILCISPSTQTWITNTPCLPFLCNRSPDGATSNWGKRHPIAAYCSSIDPEGMKG